MGATKQAVSDLIEQNQPADRQKKPAILEEVLHLGPRGITFATNTYMPQWTEVGVELRLPQAKDGKDRQVDCRGVIVHCVRRALGSGFEVALLFLDLPKKAHFHLSGETVTLHPISISISR